MIDINKVNEVKEKQLYTPQPMKFITTKCNSK